MSRAPETSSVFTDDSGTRARVLQWSARAALGAFALAVLLIVGSLVTGVPLPGLGGSILPGSGGSGDSAPRRTEPLQDRRPTAVPTSPQVEEATTGTADVPEPRGASAGSTKHPAGTVPSATPAARPTSVPPAPPAVTPTAAPTKGPNASSTKSPRAEPTKHAGGPPSAPPGKSK